MPKESIRGTCQLMCPEKERRMREREGLLHKFEVEQNQGVKRRPKADPSKIVKCFSRPAAGQIMTDPEQLRPAPVLLSTIKYLFTKIATRSDIDWIVVYDFIFDRLRAVRQDIVIQRIGPSESIPLFEPIVRFLVYAGQRLCERNISEYDPKINSQHLTECIKHLLVLYDEVERGYGKRADSQADSGKQKSAMSDHREEMEALYILIHIGDVEALHRALSLPPQLREAKDIQLAIKISLAWYLRNYVRVCNLIQRLSPILVCAALVGLQHIRRITLKIMSFAYNSKMLTYPGLKLQKLLLYRDVTKVEEDCKHFGLKFINENVLFEKATFNDDIKLARPEMYYSPRTIHNFLPEILIKQNPNLRDVTR